MVSIWALNLYWGKHWVTKETDYMRRNVSLEKHEKRGGSQQQSVCQERGGDQYAPGIRGDIPRRGA
jgi:hypothetical protein